MTAAIAQKGIDSGKNLCRFLESVFIFAKSMLNCDSEKKLCRFPRHPGVQNIKKKRLL